MPKYLENFLRNYIQQLQDTGEYVTASILHCQQAGRTVLRKDKDTAIYI
jgi:hypothetical protein